MRMKRLPSVAVVVALILALAACGTAAEFPTRTITIFNSSSAGSPADIMARQLGRSIEDLTGQTVIVENATGGSGGVMFGSVRARPTDGYTWGSFTAGQISALVSGLDRDFPIETFHFVSNVQSDVFAFNVQIDSPWETLEDLIGWAKENPGRLLIGGQGTGNSVHFSALQFAKEAGLDIVYMSFDGGADTARNLLGGHIHVGILGPTAAREFIEAGQIKMLAVTGSERAPQRPEVPSFSEFGINVPFTNYRGIFVQTGVDPATIQAISDLIRKATLTDSFVEYMVTIESEDAFMAHTEFRPFVVADYESTAAVAREFGLID